MLISPKSYYILFNTIKILISSYFYHDFISTFFRLSQPAQLLINFSISDEFDAKSVKYENNSGEFLVLNLQETELSKRNYANDVPNVECCFSSLLRIRCGCWHAKYCYKYCEIFSFFSWLIYLHSWNATFLIFIISLFFAIDYLFHQWCPVCCTL